MTSRSDRVESPAISRRRLWAFRVLAVVVATVPFLVAELYLRATSSVDSEDLSHDPIFETSAQAELFVLTDGGERFAIPPSRSNFFRPASFPSRKAEDVRRFFVLGGSTVQGRPYETETAFPKWMQLRLQASDPDHRYEVVNCGGVSYASYRVAIILSEVLRYSPDAIIIYTGHNEYLEERSYDTMRRDRRPLLRLAERSKLVRAISRSFRSRPDDRQTLSTELTTRLDLVDGMKRYVRDPEWREGVVRHFRDSLDRMIRMCESAEVPLVLCVPTSDIVTTPPFKIADLEFDSERAREFQASWAQAKRVDASADDRLQACRGCLEIDPEHAGANYLAGTLLWNRGQTEQAHDYLIAARDSDVCPLRATSAVMNTVAELAARYELALVDCDRLFDKKDSSLRSSPDGIADPERFVDHIHPSIAGHQAIGAEIARRLEALFSVTPAEGATKAYESSARRHLSALYETYFARGEQRLEGLRNWAAGRAGRMSIETSTDRP